MRKEIIVLTLLGIMFSNVITPVNATTWPSLPPTPVQIIAVDGTGSYFVTTLSGVPKGFDITNGVYAGWCIDRGTNMVRGVSHDVMLYSSLAPPAMKSINWVAINYILNHKQGTRLDIQNAIWHFTDYKSLNNENIQAMIDGALSNPGYDPATGSVLAVICLRLNDNGVVQNSIIELSHPTAPGLSPGYWKHNVKVYNGGPGRYSAPEEGMNRENSASMLSYAAKILAKHSGEMPGSVDSPEDVLIWANKMFKNPSNKAMWLPIANWFNEAVGRLPYTGN